VQKKYGAVMVAAADTARFQPNSEIKQVVSRRAWQITFETGKATFTPESRAELYLLKSGLLIAGDLAIEIQGHTDNTGDPDKNIALSQARANAVKAWLMQQSSSDFSVDRFTSVKGFGQTRPVATNETESGRAKNRRVEVILGTN
jgi:outer membrane protein OmpA-like peptidoglycan-associated protein